MLGRVDAISSEIAEVDAKIEELLVPFASAAARLDEIPGIGPIAAAVILAEIGTDMSRFPTPCHLADRRAAACRSARWHPVPRPSHPPRVPLPGPGPP
ncbi:transposase [Streptosporangium sp. NBC_01495]